MYLHEGERPVDEHGNQFFMYTIIRDVRYVNADLGSELKKRAGHYVRTELRAIYEAWVEENTSRKNRYGIPCPITDLAEQQFDDARSTIDYECDDILRACLFGVSIKNKDGLVVDALGPYKIITSKELEVLMSALHTHTQNQRTIRERLQNLKYFSRGGNFKKNGYSAWKVVGVLPPDNLPENQ
jgi:hypothetical protein